MLNTFQRLRFRFSRLLSVADSITLSGDERELGKVCVRVSYQEAAEQVWITLVQVRLHTCRKLHCAARQCLSMAPLSVLNTSLCVSFPLCSGTFGSKKIWWKTIFLNRNVFIKTSLNPYCVRAYARYSFPQAP